MRKLRSRMHKDRNFPLHEGRPMFSAIKRWFKNTKETPVAPVPVQTPAPTSKAAGAAGGRGLYWPRARSAGPAHHQGDSRTFLFSHAHPA